MKLWIFLSIFLTKTEGLSEFQGRLPNGHRIPHPCFTNTVWSGVGHKYHGGGGELNPFGQDFKNNQFTWDKCLCEADSDGDGRTNGEELGDPDCVWSEGTTPGELESLSHPGVCEPVGSETCEGVNTWDVCQSVTFDCPAIEEPGVETFDMRFNEVEIPAEETVYMNMAIEFNDTRDYHGIALTPIVINDLIVHHIDMYECVTDEEIATIRAHHRNASRSAGAMSGLCTKMIAAWSLGIPGVCLVDQVGLRLGINGAKVAKLVVHYHNPNKLTGQMDSSGLRFYVTDNLRPHDMVMFNFGQLYLEIPPGQVTYEQNLTCGPFCTNTLSEPVNLIFGALHMHYQGVAGYAELYRNGQYEQEIMRQDNYDYLTPLILNFETPVEVHPGDTIRYVCVFQTRDVTEVTWQGSGAHDEMCHIYFAYYPEQNLTECHNHGSIMTCNYNNLLGIDSDQDWAEKGCDVSDFDSAYSSYIHQDLANACNYTGTHCTTDCENTLSRTFANHTCLSGDARTGIFKRHRDLRDWQSKCAEYPEPHQGTSAPTPIRLTCAADALGVGLGYMLAVVFALLSIYWS